MVNTYYRTSWPNLGIFFIVRHLALLKITAALAFSVVQDAIGRPQNSRRTYLRHRSCAITVTDTRPSTFISQTF